MFEQCKKVLLPEKKIYVETSLNFELACNQAPQLRCHSNRDCPPGHKTADKNKILTIFVSSAFGLKTALNFPDALDRKQIPEVPSEANFGEQD